MASELVHPDSEAGEGLWLPRRNQPWRLREATGCVVPRVRGRQERPKEGLPYGEACKLVSAILNCPPFLPHLPGKLLRSVENVCPTD